MSIAKIFLISILNPRSYIWVDVVIIKKTQKAILIEFDEKKAWLPRAWIVRIKHNLGINVVKIKISQYHWEKKMK